MSSNPSSLFDRIRIKPAAEEARREEAGPACEHPGCERLATHRAPKGRGKEGQFHNFCIEHVRAYNASYNYFAGMPDTAVADYQKDAMTGHRPTWTVSANAAGRSRGGARARKRNGSEEWSYEDPLGIFARVSGQAARPEPAAARRVLSERTRAALETMGLDDTADAAAIKARYKALVKRFHPDANGGDRSFEARLQEIIRAYDALKASGMARP